MGKNRPLEEFLRVQTVFEEFVLSDKPAVERIRLRGLPCRSLSSMRSALLANVTKAAPSEAEGSSERMVLRVAI